MNQFLKYIIFKLTPNLFFDKIAYLFSKIDKQFLSEIKDKQNAFVFLGCDYANLGDYAITLAQREMLTILFPERNVHVISVGRTYSALKTILYHNNTEDIITIIGGGNISELYYGYERKRNFIVNKTHSYKVISFPQSYVFGNSSLAKLAVKRSSQEYSAHPKLMMIAREELSVSRMKDGFPGLKISLLPDVVMTLDRRLQLPRKGIVISMRNDKEVLLSDQERYDLIQIAWIYSDGKVSFYDTADLRGDNETNFKELLNTYSSAELVITDRLHGMIFSYITGTPAIILPNTNGKIGASFKWISDCGYIKFIKKDDLHNIKKLLPEMIKKKIDNDDFVNRRNNFIKMYKDLLCDI